MQANTFLFELGCEELPPKSLKILSLNLEENIKKGLAKANLEYKIIHSYATPRRLAVMIETLAAQQPEQIIERKGPAITAAFVNNNPTPALMGFLRSNKISIEQITQENERIIYRYTETGKTILEIMPELVSKAITDLPIPKPMRWSNKEVQFIRPVHWIVMLYGQTIIPATILGLTASKKTYGHRFHHPQAIELHHAEDYVAALEKAFVIANPIKRKHKIATAIQEIMQQQKADLIYNETLLEEVTNIVEWPITLMGAFDKKFLSVPKEALIAAMEDHQKCFPLTQSDRLLPYFITASNIESKEPEVVIHGNERVIRARLSDAKFFYETDCKQPLAERLELLKHVVFQAKLGTLYDKSERIAKLAGFIANQIGIDAKLAERAGWLCKTDLTTSMVGEFPELQGIMGYYYALNDKENEAVAYAIRDHYFPRIFDSTNDHFIKYISTLALADYLDTLVGIFGIDQAPTGDKDPFGLRRAAIGVLRILIEKELSLNVVELLKFAQQNYQYNLPNKNNIVQIQKFILERLNGLYQTKNVASDTIAAVLAVADQSPYDLHKRIIALEQFRHLPEAGALAEANKRANNLLSKSGKLASFIEMDAIQQVDEDLLQHVSEQQLYQALTTYHTTLSNRSYIEELTQLALLQKPVAEFFENVMVMDEDEALRNNRLALLAALRQLFLQIADISLLQL